MYLLFADQLGAECRRYFEYDLQRCRTSLGNLTASRVSAPAAITWVNPAVNRLSRLGQAADMLDRRGCDFVVVLHGAAHTDGSNQP